MWNREKEERKKEREGEKRENWRSRKEWEVCGGGGVVEVGVRVGAGCVGFFCVRVN